MSAQESEDSGVDGNATQPTRSIPVSEAELATLRRRVFATVRRRCPPGLAGQAEDIVQTVMIRLVGYLKKGEAKRSFSSIYLEKAACGAMIDEIRRRSRRGEDPGDSEVVEQAPSSAVSPERGAASAEIARGIQDCLKRLIRPRRLAVTLYLYGCTIPETAERLGWAFKRTDNLVWRGLADLRRCLQGKGLEP